MPQRKYALKDMTWVEFRERMAERPVIILPLGSQEEQGPHAPMGDYVLAERVALLVAERADAITTPIMPFGYADFFRTIPGGIQLRAKTFTMVLEDMLTAFLAHGLEHLVIFNGHTSNGPLIDQTIRKIKQQHGVAVASLNAWQLLPQEEWNRLHGENAKHARGHGADPLTSIYKHFLPELLRPDLAEPAAPLTPLGLSPAGLGAVAFEGSPVNLPLDITELTANGVASGNGAHASAKIGAEMVEWIVAYTTRFIAHFRQCDPRNLAAGPRPSAATLDDR
jgi:creatinine amidohydrolase